MGQLGHTMGQGVTATLGDVTKGTPFTQGFAAQAGAPATPEHLQQTWANPPKSPLGDGVVILISQQQGIITSKGKARTDLDPQLLKHLKSFDQMAIHSNDINLNRLSMVDVLKIYRDHSDLQQNQGTEFFCFS